MLWFVCALLGFASASGEEAAPAVVADEAGLPGEARSPEEPAPAVAAPPVAAPAVAAPDTPAPDGAAPEVEHGPDEVDPGGPVANVHHEPPRTVPERWTIPAEVLTAVRAAATAPIGVRMEVASRSFLGLPYVNDAAGEGDTTDGDPPSRYDAFDCLTFVEEVLGLTLAGDPLGAPAIRDALRYKGAPAYLTRRHFMEAEWVPDAIKNGLLEDITVRLGRAIQLDKDVTLATWNGWGRRKRLFFAIPDALLPVGRWSLRYLDLDEAARVADRIPAGALLLTMRMPRDGVPIVVTHISTVVQLPDGSRRMRHATRMGARDVRDDYVGWYVHHLKEYTNWPSLGVSVLYPREQGPRVSALTPLVIPP